MNMDDFYKKIMTNYSGRYDSFITNRLAYYSIVTTQRPYNSTKLMKTTTLKQLFGFYETAYLTNPNYFE